MTRLHEHCKTREIDLWGAIAIGVGGMVGGGIFAVLGLAATLAGGATPVAFLVAGLVVLGFVIEALYLATSKRSTD